MVDFLKTFFDCFLTFQFDCFLTLTFPVDFFLPCFLLFLNHGFWPYHMKAFYKPIIL